MNGPPPLRKAPVFVPPPPVRRAPTAAEVQAVERSMPDEYPSGMAQVLAEGVVNAEPEPATKRHKFTSVVRRGIAHITELIVDALDDSKAPPYTLVARWPQKKQNEFNRAMEWLEQEESA